MFLHRDLPRLTVTLQNKMPRKDSQSFEDQKIVCRPFLKHWLRSTPPTQISGRSSFSPSSWPQHLNERDYECPFQKWTAPGPLRQTCHRTLSLPCQITHLASTEVMSAFWVWLKCQHYFPGYFVLKGTNSRTIYPRSWGMKRLSRTFHQTIQIPNPEIEPSWKGGWNISVWSYLQVPTRLTSSSCSKGKPPIWRHFCLDHQMGDTGKGIQRFLWVRRWTKMEKKPCPPLCLQLPVLLMCSSANALYFAALTSPQGILGVLSHSISFIQDH